MTIILTTSRLSIGGATSKRGRADCIQAKPFEEGARRGFRARQSVYLAASYS